MSRKRRLTEDEYAEMAADYEAHPPTADEVLSIEVNPVFLRKGRPPGRSAAHGKTPLVPVRLPDSIREELVRRAEAEGSSASELIRRAIVEYFAHHPA